jgi:hypothetical protein
MDSSGNNPPGNASAAHGNISDPLIDATRETADPAPPLPHNDDAPAAASPSVFTLWAIYALEVLAIGFLRIPHDLALFMFAFGDRGSWLVAQYLTAHGARPTIDFGFPYGLLPLLFGRVWFAIFGLTPGAFNAAMMSGGVAMAFGMARFANAMRLSRVGQLLMVVALPVAIQSSLPGLSHLLEAVALCLAIGEHARGNSGAALALTTAACFAKAALGYLYGLLLILLIVAHCRRPATRNAPTEGVGAVTARGDEDSSKRLDWLALRRTLMPAAVTALLLLALAAPVFGMRPLFESLLPLNGMKIYQSQHFSFFSPWGRTFWDPCTQPLVRYFATPAPFWLGSTIWLALAGLLAGGHLLKQHLSARSRLSPSAPNEDNVGLFAGPPPPVDHGAHDVTGSRSWSSTSPVERGTDDGLLTRRRSRTSFPLNNSPDHTRDEIIFCCAVLQTLFVLRFFGPPTSWTYYPYIVVMGVAAASAMNSVTARVTMLLAFVAFVALDASLVAATSQRKMYAPTALTAGLWADATDRAEWSTVIRLISGSRGPRTVAAGGPQSVALRGAQVGMRTGGSSSGAVTRPLAETPASPPRAAEDSSSTRLGPSAGPRTVAVGVAGAASILFPEFEKPVGAYLVRDEATPAEVARTIEQIKAADFVVRPASVSLGDPIYAWPEMTRAFDNFQVIWKGQTYQVCRHR